MRSGKCSSEKFHYPASERVSHVDSYHGMEVPDPYRWLEELDSDQTARWVEAQNALSEPYLEEIPEREAIKKRLTELWSYERYGLPFKEGGRYFFPHNDGLQHQDVLFVSDSLDGKPRVLIDPNSFSTDATASLAAYQASPDGKHIAYGVSDGGSDWKTWKVREIETGTDLADRLKLIKFTDVSWARNGSGFYYSRYPAGSDGKGDDSASVTVYFHRVGTRQEEDELIYSIPPELAQNPYATVTEDGRYLVIHVSKGYTANAIHYKSLDRPDSEIIPLLDKWDALYQYLGNEGPLFYFKTTNEAPRSRIVEIDIRRPEPADWREIVPEAPEAMVGATFVGGCFVANYLRDAHSAVKVINTDGGVVRDVWLPGMGSADGFSGHAADSETFYYYTGYTSPLTIYRYDLATGESTPFHKPEVGIDLENFETEQVFFASKDGTRVPMFVTHRKDIERNGRNPTLLYGYGGFNVSLTPSYNTKQIVWLEMGGILAIPNLRGGGEYGEEWHLAGSKTNKQNVFDDFISAAQWLIENEYTSTPKLAIQGGSNGGLLVATAMTQRPDLFGAVHSDVGVLDMLRYHTASANAREWSSDYGLSEHEPEFRALYAYSPYHNIREGTCYPPALITTADHDDRVVPWHSFKFCAELQHAQGCANPILIRVETRAGHGAGKPNWMRIDAISDQLAFFTKVLGMKNRPPMD